MKYISRKKLRNKKGQRNRFVSLLLAMFMFFGMFSISTKAYAAEADNSETIILNSGEYLGYSEYGEGMYNYPLYIWDGEKKDIAYCFDAHKAWPSPLENLEYKLYSIYEKIDYVIAGNESIMRAIYNGYPYNMSGLQEDLNLTDMQFRAVTQAVVWKFTDGLTLEQAKAKITQRIPFVWTSDMTSAYKKLTDDNLKLTAPPDNFTLNLYTTINDLPYMPVQRLLSTSLSIDNTKPDPIPVYATSFTIEAEKRFNGNVPSKEQVFNFELINEKNEVIDTASNNEGSIAFKPIKYTAEGTYKYFIRETAGADDTIDYDSSVYEVRVVVKNNGNGILSAEALYYNSKGDSTSIPVFDNMVKVQEHSLTISKQVTGAYGDKDRMFDFEIMLEDKDGMKLSKTFDLAIGSIDGAEDNEIKSVSFINGQATVSLKHGQTATVKGIPEGSSYEVREINADDYETTIDGTYSSNKTASGSGINDDVKVEFVNRRDVVVFEGIPVKFDVEKQLEVSGEKPSEDEEFTFVLKADDESFPMPEMNTASIYGAGKTSFGEIVYTEPGNYTYTVIERNENIEGYVFDDTVYHVTVNVTAEKAGDTYKLVSDVWAVKDSSDEKEEIIFVNHYSKPEPTPEPEDPKPQPEPESPAPEPESPAPEPENPKPQPEPESPAPEPENPKPQPEPESPAPEPEDPKPQPEPESPAPEPENPKPQPEPENPAPELDEEQPAPEITPEDVTDENEYETTGEVEESSQEEQNMLPQTGNIWSDEVVIMSGIILMMIGLCIIKEMKHE